MKLNWTEFKSIYDSRELDITMIETSTIYKLVMGDYGVEFVCNLGKDEEGVTEFESDYKSLCNAKKVYKVTPTAPSNDYDLKPYGLAHKHINSSSYIYDITLSDKDDKTYTYSCSTTPAFYDCLSTTDGQTRDGVYEVDVENNELTTWYGSLANGSYKLIKPIDIDVLLPTDFDTYYLWGMYFTAVDYSLDDLARLQIVDVDDILGAGAGYIVKEYDECWVDQMHKLVFIKTPDGSPGEIPSGLYLRVKYYPKDATKTDIKLWLDYAITIKS